MDKYNDTMDKNICGIVAEYNPFHSGHAYHLAQSRLLSGADHVAVILSGNYVQRGEPAIIDKFTRTKMALLHGADIVLELPISYATASAEAFASAAVHILASTKIISHLCFGAETADLNLLNQIASYLAYETEEFKTTLRKNLKKGHSFPKARALALINADHFGLFGSEQAHTVISTPNNILAIEYLKALQRTSQKIIPIPIKRQETGFTASTLRQKILLNDTTPPNTNYLKDFMPPHSLKLFHVEQSKNAINHLDNFSPFLHYILKTTQNDIISSKILKASEKNYKISDIIQEAKTKNITLSALRRLVLRLILGIESTNEKPTYIRVLGFKKEKAFLLSELQKNASLPVIINLKNIPTSQKQIQRQIQQEIKTTDIYWLALRCKQVPPRNELSSQPIII
jgi:predicted nucleotidyltransferase